MALASTGGFAYQLDKSQDKVFWDIYGDAPTEYDKIAKIGEAPPGNYWKASELSPLGAMREKGEGDVFQFDIPVEGNQKTVYPTAYGLGYQITREMYDDDVFGHLNKMPEKLAKSAAVKIDTVFWDLLNSGFDTHTAGDGEFLFDTDHTPLKSGSDIANEPTTAGALSETTYQAAMEYFYTLKDEADNPIALSPGYTLVVPEDLRATAMKLQQNELKLGTANNDLNTANPSYGIWNNYRIHVSRFLTSATAWFMLNDEHDLNLMWKTRPEFQSADDFHTGNALFRVWMRFMTFCFSYKPMYGNPGA
jgi:phage major head subunit gpT-like protein